MKKIGIFLLLHISIMIYTFSGIVSKFTSYTDVFSWKFIALYGAEVIILGIYAVLWQQIIGRMDLSIAYANKSATLIWSLIWGISIFKESFSIWNILGIAIVIAGIIMVNLDDQSKKEAPLADREVTND